MRGFTLLELVVFTALTAFTAAALAPAARHARDRGSVLAAREAVAGLLAEARLAALGTGDAHVTLESGPWVARAEAGDSLLRALDLEGEWGVSVELAGGRTAARIEFNPAGLGRMASETVTFRRGGAASSLVVSSLGRVRRR